MKHAYAYYRIDPDQEAAAAERIDALLTMMAAHCGTAPRRFRRCDDPALWMEVYEDIAGYAAFSAALDVAVSELGCAAFIQGERHLECFSLAPRVASAHPAPPG
ncbi:MAG: DUF4936 family protein [Betaproteobacteria bacterium]|nr:DUF4936 family protein [Betaproteobacteria bacterium]